MITITQIRFSKNNVVTLYVLQKGRRRKQSWPFPQKATREPVQIGNYIYSNSINNDKKWYLLDMETEKIFNIPYRNPRY